VKGYAPHRQGGKSICALSVLILLSMCSCQGQDEAQRALEDARRLAKHGDYEGALAKHVWFHDHALEIRPSYSGVRLSFALDYWVALGNKYPKALEKLKNIRDNKTARLLSVDLDWHLFQDVASINQHLGENPATVKLFKQLEATNAVFASAIYDLADDALVEAREYALAKKYLGDAKERLVTARRNFEDGMKFANSKRTANGGADDRAAGATRHAIEDIFTEKVVRIITVLQKTGDKAVAQEIQTEALKVLDNGQIRSALKN